MYPFSHSNVVDPRMNQPKPGRLNARQEMSWAPFFFRAAMVFAKAKHDMSGLSPPGFFCCWVVRYGTKPVFSRNPFAANWWNCKSLGFLPGQSCPFILEISHSAELSPPTTKHFLPLFKAARLFKALEAFDMCCSFVSSLFFISISTPSHPKHWRTWRKMDKNHPCLRDLPHQKRAFTGRPSQRLGMMHVYTTHLWFTMVYHIRNQK